MGGPGARGALGGPYLHDGGRYAGPLRRPGKAEGGL